MKKVLEFIKMVFTACKEWIVYNGIEGILGLLMGIILWPMGYKILAGFAFGVFAMRNWDIFKSWVMKRVTK
tara:strand:- start:171 stop:383 length:213 start_codon:yes stop_codon:yes gene_type:complete